ncbi:MAG: YkuS family protein [Bacillota bacterium]
MKRVAIGRGVSDNLTEMLKGEGYEVISPYRGEEVDAVILSGMSNNFMSRQEITTDAPVIDASGKTPEEIVQRLRDLRYH